MRKREFVIIDKDIYHDRVIYTEALEIYLEGCLVRTVTEAKNLQVSTVFIPNVRIKMGPKKELVSCNSYGSVKK